MIRTIAGTAAATLGLAPALSGLPPVAPGRLEVGYAADAGYAVAVVLRCHPPGGPHPHATEACRQLAAVHGRPERLTPAATMCTMIWAPVTASIHGPWHGRTVDWTQRYGNTCEMTRATGAIFDF